MVERPTERTLYPLLLEVFEELGFTGVQEIKIPGRRYPDAKISYKDSAFYVQVKIGKLDKVTDIINDISKLMVAKESYEEIKDVIGFIGIKFDEDIRKVSLVTGKEKELLRKAVESSRVFIIISALKQGRPLLYIVDGEITFSKAVQELISKIREFIEEEKPVISLESVIKPLKEYIDELAYILRTYYLSQSSEALVKLIGDVSLFKSLVGLEEKEDINKILENEDYKAAFVDLLAFILVNQILFYYLYSKRSEGKLPELKQIQSLTELKKYFDKILEIDFRVIYEINVFERLPNDQRIINVINNIINALNASPVWKVPHDLLGRVYHELLPFRTRKVFATFYTHPIAAEILAGLTIDDYKETVIDPACGSGTLLVAAYNTKKRLYSEHKSFISVEDEIRLHKQFVERDITGIDIMPFAAHIAAMNLALQNIEAETNNLRIGVEDSLNILDKLASIGDKNWTLALETVSTELIKIIKGLRSKQESILKYINSENNRKSNIIIYVVDSSESEEELIKKLKNKGYKLYSLSQDSIELSNNVVIANINRDNVSKLYNLLNKAKSRKSHFNLTIIVRKGMLSEELVEYLKEMFEDIPIETRDIFTIRPFDVVIMNPPFSNRKTLPKEYQEKLNNLSKRGSRLYNIIGNRINLWGYFIVLSHFLLKENGKMGLVIPINIARGKDTEKLRKFILENYHIRWIVKSVADLAFSEAAAFRDILFIAEKRKPKENDITGIVFIKKSIRSPEFTVNEARRIVKDLRMLYEEAKDGKIKNKKYKDPKGFYEVYFIDSKNIIKYSKNLMPIIGFHFLDTLESYQNIMKILSQKNLEEKAILFKEGLTGRWEGFTKAFVITSPYHPSRIKRATLILKNITNAHLEFFIKDTNNTFIVRKNEVFPFLRSVTGFSKLYINEKVLDYIIYPAADKEIITTLANIFEVSKKALDTFTKLKEKLNLYLTKVIIPRKYNVHSKNSKIIAFYSDLYFIPSDKFYIPKNVDENLYISLAILFNSIVFLIQLKAFGSQTEGEFLETSAGDLELFLLPHKEILINYNQTLLNLYNEIKDIEFPSIMEQMKKGWEYMKQYKDKSWEEMFDYLKENDPGMYARIKLDYTILKVLGFADNEIKDLLEKAYEVVYKELEAIKKAK